ncbi:coiled-coil domain-containing protein 9 isoform X2 [Alosa sapidissima]|uniref:coiled-coil domain-containing protein 9 isoform X2 n=1 Tax=Alosa sapidissima TaxID=34773 RepID=UPI001C0874EA|nr:coiled-coil domain-containing protein 9 isoform X2 [Alosa sapidissima]
MSAAVEIKTKEEKDAELDRRIEALRKKNQALVRRYQEIEEDKKKAEDEGIAVTLPRRTRGGHEHDDWPKPEKESFTVTVDLSKPGAVNRVVNDRRAAAPHVSEKGDAPRSGGEGPSHRPGMVWARGGQRGGGPRPERRDPRPERHDPHSDRPPRDDEGGERPARGGRGPRGGRRGRGGPGPGPGPDTDRKSKEWEEKRRQNIAMMNEEMEKIAEYERGQKADGEKPIRNFLDDPRRSGPVPDMDRKEGSRRHVRNWGGLDFESVKTGAEMEKEWMSHRSGGKGSVDMTLSMTGRERAEYLRWKKEREQIDEERLARHRNATGQWRREWDAEKTDTMFKETPEGAGDLTPRQGGRRDENKRAPRAPKFGDFLGSGSRDGDRKGRVPKKGRGQDNYSMHDNRWKSEKEEEKGQEEEHETGKEKPSNETTEVKDEVEKPAPAGTSEAGTAEEDEDEWEDASDGDDEDELEDAPDTPPRAPATSSPKERRAPVVHIPPPQDAQASPEGDDFAVAAEVVDKTTEAPAEEAIQQSDSSLPPKEEQTDDAQAPNASKDAEDAEDVVSPTTEPPPNEAEENPPDQPASG